MRRPGYLADAEPLDWDWGQAGLINAPVPIAIQIEKLKQRRAIEKIRGRQRPPRSSALGIPTEHLVIGGLLATLLLRKDSLPIDNLLLPLAGVGAFLWYKNKTKEAPFMPHGVLPPTMPMRPPPKIAFTTPLPPSAEESPYCAPSWGSLEAGEFSPGAVLIGTKEGDTIDAALLRIKAHPKLKDFNFSIQQQGWKGSALIKVGSAIGDSKCRVTSEAVKALKEFGGLRYAEVNGIYRAT